MASKRIYLSPSNQETNIGIDGYNEETQMHILAKLVSDYLKKSPMFDARISNPEWVLKRVVDDSDDWYSDLHICLHSDAGPNSAEGTTVFFYRLGGEGEKFAKLLYSKIAPLSPGKDRGIVARPGLYELSNTKCPAVLIENFFHTNVKETNHFIFNMDEYAKSIANAVYEFYGIPFEEPKNMVNEYKTILAKKWNISNPETLWNLLDKHPYYEILYKKMVDSYSQK